MGQSQVILTIGGGGFTHGTDPALEDFCLRFLPPMPDLGYIGWANRDDERRIARFYARFSGVAGSLSHLPLGADAARCQDWMEAKHLIYLGGGNTLDLIAALRTSQSLPMLLTASRSGCVLAGVSAGGVCWFDWILSDSGGNGYAPIDGLAVVKGGVCPHYSSEPARKAPFEAALPDAGEEPAHAVDDGACLVSVDGRVHSFFSARPDRAAHRLVRQGETVTITRLPKFA